jgi:hypothetical protein
MLFEDLKKNKGAKTDEQLPNIPIINENNQFQMLHLYALFGLNDKKKVLTKFIQDRIDAKNLFNYLL